MADPCAPSISPINSTCEICQQLIPTQYCTCTGRKIAFCGNCVGKHCEKFKNLPHSILAIDIQVEDYYGIHQRAQNLAKGKAELEQNIVMINQCCEEVKETVEKWIEELKLLKNQWVKELQDIRDKLTAEISQAVNEVETTLSAETVQLHCKYSEALRSYRPGELVLFGYELDKSSIQSIFASRLTLVQPGQHSRRNTQEQQTCVFCKLMCPASEFELLCDCFVCTKCAVLKAKESNNSTSCWSCGQAFPTQYIDSLSEKSGLGKIQHCSKCGDTISEKDTVMLVCGDAYHNQCLFAHAREAVFALPSQRVLCCACGIEVYADKIPDWWSFYADPDDPNPPQLVMYKQVNGTTYEIHCPQCKDEDTGVEITRQISCPEPATCTRCGLMYCVLCLDKWGDQYHLDGFCRILTSWKEIETLEKQKTPAVQCPYCKIAQAKNGTGWQQCTACEQYFCAECVARYDPIAAHGDKYHREDCPYHSEVMFFGEFSDKCTVCKLLGGDKACNPPQRLARKGQFTPAELI